MAKPVRSVVFRGSAVLIGLALAFRLGAVARASFRSHHADLAEERALVTRAAAVAAAIPALRAARDSARHALVAAAPVLLAAGKSPEAHATLSVLVSEAAERYGVNVTSVQPLADSLAGGLIWAALHVEAEADLEGLARTLAAIESDPRGLVIPGLRVTSAGVAANRDAAERLRVELVVAGWYLPMEATP